jgi:hypothetical protein
VAPLIKRFEKCLMYLVQQRHQETAPDMPVKLLNTTAFENNVQQ